MNYYHENNIGGEVDAIVELRDVSKIDEAVKNLIEFKDKWIVKPSFLCVISGMIDYAYQRPDGVYVVPITTLKP